MPGNTVPPLVLDPWRRDGGPKLRIEDVKLRVPHYGGHATAEVRRGLQASVKGLVAPCLARPGHQLRPEP
jgi:hypothetical protein